MPTHAQHQSDDPNAHGAQDDPADVTPGDDERENREHIEQTGEPRRDRLGNAEGAS